MQLNRHHLSHLLILRLILCLFSQEKTCYNKSVFYETGAGFVNLFSAQFYGKECAEPMENLLVSVNVVLPLFLMMALGYVLKALHFYDDTLLSKMNNLVFKVFLPILLFTDLYATDLEQVFNPRLILYAALSVLAAFFLSVAFACIAEKNNRIRSALIQGIFRSNFIIFGVPIAVPFTAKQRQPPPLF